MAGLLLILALSTCSDAPPAEARPPANDEQLQFWLQTMARHRFSVAEVRAATGLSAKQIAAAQRRLNVDLAKPPPRPDGRLLVLPYPGGRHPRIGFLEGAIRPQRETKFSVFAPWSETSYVVADIPEAIWPNLGLTYLAHTHIDTIWTGRNIELEKLEWRRGEAGVLAVERVLPNEIKFAVEVRPQHDSVRMEMLLTNGTDKRLTDLRVQNCVMLKGAPEFVARSKMFEQGPYGAVGDDQGERWLITAWSPNHRVWSNERCPCLHSDPKFPDCGPGETRRLVGWLSFYEGKDIAGEIQRIEATGWREERKPTE